MVWCAGGGVVGRTRGPDAGHADAFKPLRCLIYRDDVSPDPRPHGRRGGGGPALPTALRRRIGAEEEKEEEEIGRAAAEIKVEEGGRHRRLAYR